MARRGRVVYKRQSKRGARRRRNCDDSESNDGDEEYIVGEDEEDSECSDEFIDSECSDYASFEEEEEQEFVDDKDDDFTLSNSRRSQAAKKNKKKKAGAGVGGEDEEFEVSSVGKRKTSSGSRKRRKSSSSDDDEDFDPDAIDFDEEEVGSIQKNVNKSSKKKKSSSRSRRRQPKNKKSKGSRKKKKVKKAATVNKSRRSGRTKSDDDFIVDDDGDDDDDDDFVVKDRVGLGRVRKNGRRRGSNVGGMKSTEDSSEEFDFIVDSSEEEFEEREEEKKSLNSNKVRNNAKRKISNAEDLESEFDSFISGEDVRELDAVLRRKVRKRTRTTRKKKRLTADTDSSDFDYEISEGELRDLQTGWISDPEPPGLLQLPKGPVPDLKIEVKGKKKDREDVGKPICGICLSEEQKATIQGVLDCCAHYYCFQCIMEWSKVESRCPVCKRRFTSISKSVRSYLGFGLRRQVITVPKRDQVYQPSEEEMRGYIDPYENVVCIVCQQGGEDSIMLLCDICDSSAHTYCVGLGREVPEGNWYCEACRLADSASPHSLFQDSVSEQGASSGDLFSAGTEIEDLRFNFQSSANGPQSVLASGGAGQHLPHAIDLNAPPKDCYEDDLLSPSQASGSGASTLSGRRAIHQRIRFILSSNANRLRELFSMPPNQRNYEQNDVRPSLLDTEPAATTNASRNLNLILNDHSAGYSRFRLSPCMHRDDNFRHVDGAKEYVQSRVKDHLKKVSKDVRLDHSTFKDIARRSTHTILAACGIAHRKEKVIGPVQNPTTCIHGLGDGPVCLAMGCCISCLNSFIEAVVLRVMNTSS